MFRDYHAALIADLGGDKAEAEKRFKSAYAAEKNTLRLVDAYARFLATHGQPRRGEAALSRLRRGRAASSDRHRGLAALEDGQAARRPSCAPPTTARRKCSTGWAPSAAVRATISPRSSICASRCILRRRTRSRSITLGDIYERMKQEETAIDLYHSVPKDSPLRVNADVQAALLLETLGKTKEASEHLSAIVAANPKNQEALTALGNLQRSRKLSPTPP